ncbi:hypothetical protein AGABI2DRAFT_195121 [Agaricus bisporus var. bisporus H97]|uniref:hypothetical protein n=1 Tax=Agaricus bisporus var. bisporus (strain H97 / ATCC MYA-4626 / FGSC 10389) TaxID=936046 RepID=UPI00029F7B36|nr:hypothetical protein AGABI2DRAFT_195121 [Agaricus bisporus var. bisporus H97]EKV43513.1 hypothetical protein AGABI2DRAFT_195121 [Agaricus bisporus var. bisporus H97]
MSKTLSTGTLSLRFMQNAHRRQQLTQVELERAEVKDESKWEVGQEIKDAWGIGKEIQKHDSVEYESSYLPFLFPSEHEDVSDGSQRPLGRRMFNKKGEDISKSRAQNYTTDDLGGSDDVEEGELGPESTANSKETSPTKGHKFKVHTKPKSISSVSGRTLKGFDTLDQPKKESQKSSEITSHKSAREAIFNSLNGVGIDLRPSKHTLERNETDGTKDLSQTSGDQKQKQSSASIPSKGFLKPSGIDAPASRKPAADSPSNGKSAKSRASDIIEGARKKRPRGSGDASDGNKKRSKKKRSMVEEGAPVPS